MEHDGVDLLRQETLPLTTAGLASTLEFPLGIPTLEGGMAEVKIPAGTQPDTVFRLRDKELPHIGLKGKGYLFLKIRIEVQEKLNREECDLFEQLKALGGKT